MPLSNGNSRYQNLKSYLKSSSVIEDNKQASGPYKAKHHIREMLENHNLEPEISIQVQGKKSLDKMPESRSMVQRQQSPYKSFK